MPITWLVSTQKRMMAFIGIQACQAYTPDEEVWHI